MSEIIHCPRCGAENSSFARFMKLSRCRQCGHDLELVEVSEGLRRGEVLRGQSDLYVYEASQEGISFEPRGLLLAPPLKLDLRQRRLSVSGGTSTNQGLAMLWERLKGNRKVVGFEQVMRVEVIYQLEILSRENHPYQHHWDVTLILRGEVELALGRITAERQFPGPVQSHHHALRLAHALHELAGFPVEQQERETLDRRLRRPDDL
jgi:hypothetical protein